VKMIIALVSLILAFAPGAFAAGTKASPKEMAMIKSATYVVKMDGHKAEPVEFKDGEYRARNEKAKTDYTFNIWADTMLITKGKVAYVVQGMSRGGTGYWMQIKAVDLKNDPAIEIKSFPRIKEDRVKVEKISIVGKTLVLDILKHGGTDVLCCPTHKDKIRYEL
jgi:hypothetical protein